MAEHVGAPGTGPPGGADGGPSSPEGETGARYPFSAVRGQDDARLALLLAAVDPGIGGVLLRGDKGSGKSTLARALAGLLPGGGPFVELPVGASEDRVVGSFDVSAALGGGGLAFRAGLLGAAHDGVLYVDEVNLLPDHLVDVLLDAAASGVNTVERDGVSHRHPARFVLVGSMNPEEGELRPQLLDRFGLAVNVVTPRDPGLRAAVVAERLDFERRGGPAVEAAAAEDRSLAARLADAAPAGVPADTIAFASRLALAVGAEGLRADLVLCRAAAALAGWEGRASATPADIERVAPLALAHRRRRAPFDPPELPPEALAEALERARRDAGSGADEAGPDRQDGGSPPTSGSDPVESRAERDGGHPEPPAGPDRTGSRTTDGQDTDRRVTAGRPPAGQAPAGTGGGEASDGPTWGQLAGGSLDRPTGGAVTARAGRRFREGPDVRGPQIGDRPGDPGGRVSLAATVRTGAQRRARDAATGLGPEAADPATLTAGDLRAPVHRRRAGRCVILTVDTSGSMGTPRRVEAATGAVLGLLADAYRSRHRVGLVAFRGAGAEVALPPTASIEVARARLADLPTGGVTPLADGIRAARGLARRAAEREEEPLVVVLTDGRATGERGPAGPAPFERALEEARALAGDGTAAVVLDAEDAAVPLGLATRLAGALRAPCVPLAGLTAGAVENAIRSALGER